MEEQIKNPIDQLAYLLGAMTTRAMEAERERDAAKLDAENWYQNYRHKDEQLEECRRLLETEKAKNQDMEQFFKQESEAHARTRDLLQKYRNMVEDGGCDHE